MSTNEHEFEDDKDKDLLKGHRMRQVNKWRTTDGRQIIKYNCFSSNPRPLSTGKSSTTQSLLSSSNLSSLSSSLSSPSSAGSESLSLSSAPASSCSSSQKRKISRL
eukprot:g15056.t1